ncbi:MAG: protein kinase [Candidatus Micrarchaeota archaeon]
MRNRMLQKIEDDKRKKEPYKCKEHGASEPKPLVEAPEPPKFLGCAPIPEPQTHEGKTEEPEYHGKMESPPPAPIDYGPQPPTHAGPPIVTPPKHDISKPHESDDNPTQQSDMETKRSDVTPPEEMQTPGEYIPETTLDKKFRESGMYHRMPHSEIIEGEIANTEYWIRKIKHHLTTGTASLGPGLKWLKDSTKRVFLSEKVWVCGSGSLGAMALSLAGLAGDSLTGTVISGIFGIALNSLVYVFANATAGFVLAAGSARIIISSVKRQHGIGYEELSVEAKLPELPTHKNGIESIPMMQAEEMSRSCQPEPEEQKDRATFGVESIAITDLQTSEQQEGEATSDLMVDHIGLTEVDESDEEKIADGSMEILNQIGELQRQLETNGNLLHMLRKTRSMRWQETVNDKEAKLRELLEKLEHANRDEADLKARLKAAEAKNAKQDDVITRLNAVELRFERARDLQLFALGITALELNHEMERTGIPEIMWETALRIRARTKILVLDKKSARIYTPIEKGRINFGKYICDYNIGSGGLGTVYLARDNEDNRAAIKTLRPDLQKRKDSKENEGYIVREANILTQISHPHIVQIYESGTEKNEDVDDVFYYAAELINGLQLDIFLEFARSMPMDEKIAILYMAASAFEAMHAKGIVYGDAKPGNIMLTYDPNTIKIIDFNLAGRIDDTILSAAIGGSVGYAAPERIKRRMDLTEQEMLCADVYSFGMTAYHVIMDEPRYVPKDKDTHRILTYEANLKERDNAFDSESLRGMSNDLRNIFMRMGINDVKKRDLTFTEIKEVLMEQYLLITGQKRLK